MLPLKLHQLTAFIQTALAFNVMRENQREFFPLRPARPAVRFLTGGFIDGPYVLVNSPLSSGHDPPHSHPQTPRQIWFEAVIKSVAA